MRHLLSTIDGLRAGEQREALLYINATPDADYPARILRAHLESNTSSIATDNLLGLPPENPLCKAMNEAQEERAKLLRKAIGKLNLDLSLPRSTLMAQSVRETLREMPPEELLEMVRKATPPIRATNVSIVGKLIGGAHLSVDLTDGRTIQTPLSWYPRLQAATDQQRADYRLIGDGVGVHWPQIDEDLSIDGMLAGRRARVNPR